jgi:hypothetical protein
MLSQTHGVRVGNHAYSLYNADAQTINNTYPIQYITIHNPTSKGPFENWITDIAYKPIFST